MIAQSGVPFPFLYTAYDMSTGLFIRARVYDVTTPATPVLADTIDMSHVAQGTYVGVFTGTAGKAYAVEEVVYTDETFTTPSPFYSPGSIGVQCVNISALAGGGGGSVPTARLVDVPVAYGVAIDVDSESGTVEE